MHCKASKGKDYVRQGVVAKDLWPGFGILASCVGKKRRLFSLVGVLVRAFLDSNREATMYDAFRRVNTYESKPYLAYQLYTWAGT